MTRGHGGLGSVTGDVRLLVNDTGGDVHTGSGHQFHGTIRDSTILLIGTGQHSGGEQHGSSERHGGTGRPGAAAPPVSAPHLAWLRRRFVPPEGYAGAAAALRGHGAVLLSGPRGAGRRSAALMLLHDVPAGLAAVREPFAGELAADGGIAEGDRLLLDLRSLEAREVRELRRSLAGLCWLARERSGALVILLRTGHEPYLAEELRAQLVRLDRPDPATVLLRHLRAEGVRCGHGTLPERSLRIPFTAYTMRQLAHLAGSTARSPDTGIERRIEAGLRALTLPAIEVADQVRGLREERDRALLFAAAMLPGGHAELIEDAAEALALRLGAAEEAPLLRGPDLLQRFTAIGAELDERRQVRFPNEGYAELVAAHFWANYPRLRSQFTAWLTTMLSHPRLDRAGRTVLLHGYLRHAGASMRTEDLLATVRGWRTGPNAVDGRLREAACTVLAGLWRTGEHALGTYAQTLEWASSPGTGAALAATVLDLCVETLAYTSPVEALIRLEHLTRNAESRLAETAVTALLDLATAPGNYRRLLELLRTRGQQRAPAAAEIRLWRGLLDPGYRPWPENLPGAIPGQGTGLDSTVHKGLDWLAAMLTEITNPLE
ncbi:hypothetical protein [Sciscionella marina]|uniref:hypothetical protein n=1 Tax=Sciscionella marina TaxID=508770 RepID=UPI000379C41E|nr:hypothetical protein [Sciscionella marina]